MKTLFMFFLLSVAASQVQAELHLPVLPEPISSNAITKVTLGDDDYLYTFAGLSDNNNLGSAHHKVWRLLLSENNDLQWQAMSAIPIGGKSIGKLASSAISIGEDVFLLLGYDISEPTAKKLKSKLFRYHAPTDKYTQLEPMPVAVDDTVMLSYRDRYIYVISGWHQQAPVNLVQVYDVIKNEWFQATPLPNTGLFGHAGAIIDNTFMICDGATHQALDFQSSQISLSSSCYFGEINFTDPTRISWKKWAHPTDKGMFRLVAQTDYDNERFVFLGGADAIHNFSGKQASGEYVKPNGEIWIYDLLKQSWQVLDNKQTSMDNKGLVIHQGEWLTLGGLTSKESSLTTHAKVKFHQPIASSN